MKCAKVECDSDAVTMNNYFAALSLNAPVPPAVFRSMLEVAVKTAQDGIEQAGFGTVEPLLIYAPGIPCLAAMARVPSCLEHKVITEADRRILEAH